MEHKKVNITVKETPKNRKSELLDTQTRPQTF